MGECFSPFTITHSASVFSKSLLRNLSSGIHFTAGFLQTAAGPLQMLQGMQENQQVVFLSDGGEDVRNLQVYLNPQAEHLLDWFHITMRLTVLRQKALGVNANEILETIERIKHYLWHGNVFQALQHIEFLQMDVDCIEDRTAKLEKLEQGVAEFLAYIQNNRAHIPNYGERYRHDETISTGFVESTVNQVVSKRFAKKQQMQWTPRGAHLLLQTRTKVLNEDLEETFRGWYPAFRHDAEGLAA